MANSPSRADPFALPSETDAHFTLLIISVLGASILLYELLFNHIPPLWTSKIATQERCAQEVATLLPGDDLERSPLRIEARATCERPMRLAQAGFELGGCLLLFGAAIGLYWWLPGRTVRRRGFQPLAREDDPELVQAIDDLAAEQGLTPPPAVVCNPLNRSGGGVAFGRVGRRYLGLYGGTMLRFRRDRDLFQAVVLHELAHVRNADLDKAALAVTVWWAFVAVALLPAAVVIVVTGSGSLAGASGLGWRTLALTALVLLTRAAVLREREMYADQRLLGAGIASSVLERALSAVPSARGVPWPMLDRVRGTLANHPPAAERVAALEEPWALFHFSRWTAFGAGMAATVAVDSISTLAYELLPPALLSYESFIGGLIVVTPMVWVVAVSMWRAEWYRPAALRSGVVLGLALSCGVYVGSRASLVAYTLDVSPGVLAGVERLVFEIAYLALITVSMCLFVVWIQTTTRAWLPFARRPRTSLVLAALAASVVLVLWFAFVGVSIASGVAAGGPVLVRFAAELAQFGFPVNTSASAAVVIQVFAVSILQLVALPLTPLVIALIWALPLGIGIFVSEAPRTRWLMAALVSVVAGLLACPFVIAAFFVLNQTSSTVGAAVGTGLTLAAFQAAAGLIVLARASAFRGLHGLMTAHLTGGVSALVLSLLAGGADFAVMLMLWTGGTFLSAPIVLGAAPLLGWLHREPTIAPAPAV